MKAHPLVPWMNRNGYNYKSLAAKLKYSDTYIFKIANGTRPGSYDFEMRFIDHFGVDEARKVFRKSRLVAMLQAVPTP